MNRMIFTILLGLIGFQSQALAQNPQAEFLKAIAAGKVTEVHQLLSTNPSLAHTNASSGTSALLYAAYNRQPQVAAVLLPYREADLTIFESAALGQNTRLLTLLRQDPKLVNAVSGDGFTPLHLASFFGQASSLELLIRKGARLETHSQNQLNATPLQSAVAAHQVKSAAVLLGHRANPNCRGELGYTPLFEAAESGQVDVLVLLLKHGADRSIKGTDGKTALDVATTAHQTKIEQILSPGRG